MTSTRRSSISPCRLRRPQQRRPGARCSTGSGSSAAPSANRNAVRSTVRSSAMAAPRRTSSACTTRVIEPLIHQRKALAEAGKALDALRRDGAQDMRAAMNKRPGAGQRGREWSHARGDPGDDRRERNAHRCDQSCRPLRRRLAGTGAPVPAAGAERRLRLPPRVSGTSST